MGNWYRSMNYNPLKEILFKFYAQKGIEDAFDKDNNYLESAFHGIESMWLRNYHELPSIKLIVIAEAPLWGSARSYIYNPETRNTQFFYRSDLASILNSTIATKAEFIRNCNDLGLIFLDISPFAFHPLHTVINYTQLSKSDYRSLVQVTLPYFFEQKVALLTQKIKYDVQIVFRYKRVKDSFENLLATSIAKFHVFPKAHRFGDIALKGGGVDRIKLKLCLSNV